MLVSQLAKLVATKQGRENDLIYQSELVDEIISHNSRLVKQRMMKGSIDPIYIQTINQLKLVKVDDLVGKLLRTEEEVPKPIALSNGMPFISVFNSGLGKSRRQISYIRPEQLDDIKHRKYTSNNIYYTYENNYAYIINTLTLEQIGIRAVFDNPFDVGGECIIDDELVISEVNASLITSFYSGNAQAEV